MKICHPYLFFSIRFAGGTCDLMYKICKAQEKQGHEPMIFCGHYEFDENLAKSLPGTKVTILKSWLDRAGFSLMPGLWKALVNEGRKIDVVHMHTFRTFQNYMFYRFCKKNNIPYVIDAHGAAPYGTRKNILKRIFDLLIGRSMLHEAAFLIAETKVGVEEYIDIDPSLDRGKIITLSPPLDTDEFEKLPSKGKFRVQYNISQDTKIIMFLGRVAYIKGNDFLIAGFSELCNRRDDCLLMIVGSDWGHMDDCKTLVKELNIENKVTFTGFIGGQDKNNALIDADLVVQMSRHEQGAWAPFEAVLCGTPIIVTENTGAGEDVKRVKAGETVEFGNIDSLADTMESVLDNYDLALEKTEIARNYILTKMSMNARAHEYTDVYQKAIDGLEISNK